MLLTYSIKQIDDFNTTQNYTKLAIETVPMLHILTKLVKINK